MDEPDVPSGPRAPFPRVSVVIPARDAALYVGETVRAAAAQPCPGIDIEVIVVDDGSQDATATVARQAGAKVISLPRRSERGNPAAARNRGAEVATGDPIVFLDADCRPTADWLNRLLAGHASGASCVGGSLDLPRGLGLTARCDYYCGWYHVHPRRRPGRVANHPPGNLSVRRGTFLRSPGFDERQPVAYAHEELAWQGRVREAGEAISFEPGAVVFHFNRPGLGNLLRRNYRWGYSSIESKAESGAARMAWLYRHPRMLIAASLPLAPLQAAYILVCWLRAGRVEPLALFPILVAARLAYALGAAIGGVRWLMRQDTESAAVEPRWV